MMLLKNLKTQGFTPNYITGMTACYFAAIVKKPKMELTLRTPYKTIFDKFEGWSRIITKTNEATLVIQNKTPASIYAIPPGQLKVKLTSEVKGVSGDFLHLGGWIAVHLDNTCEINLLDCMDKKEVRPDQFDKTEHKDQETVAGKYVTKVRRSAIKTFTKKATA